MKDQANQIKAAFDLRAFIRDRYNIPVVSERSEWWTFAYPPWRCDSDSQCFKVCREKWKDHAKSETGDIIDVVQRMERADNAAAQGILLGWMPQPAKPKPVAKPFDKTAFVKAYDYRNQYGNVMYQALRYEPKDFRQRKWDGNDWQWNMGGVERVLYNLPEVTRSDTVVLVEGEKDADTLTDCGMVASTNTGGSGAWSDGYADVLRGKAVVVIPDVDEPGKKWSDAVIASLVGKAKSILLVNLPKPFSDITEYADEFNTQEIATAKVQQLIAGAADVSGGLDLPLYTIRELELRYIENLKKRKEGSFDLGKWLPTLGQNIRPVRAGDVVTIVADTGAGKSAVVQNIAIAAEPLATLIFSLELGDDDIIERYYSIMTGVKTDEVEDKYEKKQQPHPIKLPHIITCTKSRLSIEQVGELVIKSELKFGRPPAVVMIDYIGLLNRGKLSRYEAISDAAERAKVLAKDTRTIVFLVSQVRRATFENKNATPGLHDAKDSGAIENSSQLILSLHRPEERPKELEVLPLKCTRGFVNQKIICEFDTATMKISEQKRIADKDVPL